MASSPQIFTIPEVLEVILFHLPEKDLLLDQRVSTLWRDITKTRAHLQRKLGFIADPMNLSDPPENMEVRCNPLAKVFMKGECPHARNYHPYEPMDNSLFVDLKALKMADYPEASWKVMFLTQPAAGGVMLNELVSDNSDDVSVNVGTIINFDGVKMGQMRDLVWPLRPGVDESDIGVLTNFRFLDPRAAHVSPSSSYIQTCSPTNSVIGRISGGRKVISHGASPHGSSCAAPHLSFQIDRFVMY